MKLTLWVATIGTLLAAPVFALAQQSPRLPDPADPRAAVPPAVYESPFVSTSRHELDPEHAQATPDKLWRAANATVTSAQSHGGHGGHGGHGEHGAAAVGGHAHAGHAPAPQTSPAPSTKPADQPAADHGKHH